MFGGRSTAGNKHFRFLRNWTGTNANVSMFSGLLCPPPGRGVRSWRRRGALRARRSSAAPPAESRCAAVRGSSVSRLAGQSSQCAAGKVRRGEATVRVGAGAPAGRFGRRRPEWRTPRRRGARGRRACRAPVPRGRPGGPAGGGQARRVPKTGNGTVRAARWSV